MQIFDLSWWHIMSRRSIQCTPVQSVHCCALNSQKCTTNYTATRGQRENYVHGKYIEYRRLCNLAFEVSISTSCGFRGKFCICIPRPWDYTTFESKQGWWNEPWLSLITWTSRLLRGRNRRGTLNEKSALQKGLRKLIPLRLRDGCHRTWFELIFPVLFSRK